MRVPDLTLTLDVTQILTEDQVDSLRDWMATESYSAWREVQVAFLGAYLEELMQEEPRTSHHSTPYLQGVIQMLNFQLQWPAEIVARQRARREAQAFETGDDAPQMQEEMDHA